ncbi:hypothetical protein LX36DRAFT_183568 [Colletotrichum falcatum]|nr:hypothetical protein LX36DRAFT_183568 [Colletotrichum falcatum]
MPAKVVCSQPITDTRRMIRRVCPKARARFATAYEGQKGRDSLVSKGWSLFCFCFVFLFVEASGGKCKAAQMRLNLRGNQTVHGSPASVTANAVGRENRPRCQQHQRRVNRGRAVLQGASSF